MSIEKIEQYTAEGESSFLTDSKTYDAVIRNFEIIGEEEGLASVMGRWDDFDEIGEVLTDIPSIREKGGFGRNVSF